MKGQCPDKAIRPLETRNCLLLFLAISRMETKWKLGAPDSLSVYRNKLTFYEFHRTNFSDSAAGQRGGTARRDSAVFPTRTGLRKSVAKWHFLTQRFSFRGLRIQRAEHDIATTVVNWPITNSPTRKCTNQNSPPKKFLLMEVPRQYSILRVASQT